MNYPITHVPDQSLLTVDKSFISTLGAEPVYPVVCIKLNLQNAPTVPDVNYPHFFLFHFVIVRQQG